jgi:hypothetical protein
VVPSGIVELTAQLVTSEGSQIAASIDEKLRVGDVVFLGEAVQKRRRGVCPAAAVDIDFEQALEEYYNHRGWQDGVVPDEALPEDYDGLAGGS